MKRLLVLLLTMAMLFSLVSCGGSGDNKTPNTSVTQISSKEDATSGHVLSLDQTNRVANYADFSLFKIKTSKIVEASMAGGGYYENSNAGETYIDVILDLTNTGTQPMACEDVLVATAINSTGTEFECQLYAVETDSYTDVSLYDNIAPLCTVRLHCGISVPEDETALTINLDIHGEAYTYEYTVGETIANVVPLTIGQAVEDENFANMVFQGAKYTEDLLPANTSSFYTHYEVDNTDNIYLVAKFDITNYQSTSKQADSFVSVKAVYMDKYTYTGAVIVEDSDGAGFSQYESIDPLSTRNLFVLIEVPKVVIDKPAELLVTFNGQEYTYTHNA